MRLRRYQQPSGAHVARANSYCRTFGLDDVADYIIVVKSDQIPRIQEVHASIYHVMLDVLEAIRGGQ